jgi:hypothetical protein
VKPKQFFGGVKILHPAFSFGDAAERNAAYFPVAEGGFLH